MTVRTSLPGPRFNRTRAGFIGLADDLAGTDLIVAAGDFTGGTPEDEFNLTSHGLITGDYLWLLYKSAAGVVTGRAGTRFRVKIVDANSFQITDTAGTVIENTADGTAAFLKGSGDVSDAYVQTVILPNLIVANGDFTGGAAEDVFYPTIETGFGALEDADPIKLLYKSAAGVLTGIAAGTTVYVKTIVAQATTVPGKFETAATAGGADIENTADGLAIFIKTA
jgi:hypothetical protein